MKSKTSAKKTKMPAARAKAKPAGKPAARKAAAKAPAKAAAKGPAAKPRVAASPKVAPYTPKPIEGIGWAPFRYSP